MRVVVCGLALSLACLSGPSAAGAATPFTVDNNQQCARLSGQISRAVKEMAQVDANSVGDNSAPRATMRAVQIGTLQAEVQNYILLMSSNNCKPHTGPISPKAYALNATLCEAAMRKEVGSISFAGGKTTAAPPEIQAETKKACDQTQWTPLPLY